MNKIKLPCPAKLNLNLTVLRKKIDGMHEINSQFQLINLFDEMKIEKTTSKLINVSTNIYPSIDGEKNIVYQAISELSNYIGRQVYCNISIKKNIPLGSGLGGGSSNAAAALIGVNVLFELGLSSKDLITIGKKVGADVPFFIFGKNAHASGTGDILIKAKSPSEKKYLLLFPQIHSSTKELFFQWDKLSTDYQNKILRNEKNSFLSPDVSPLPPSTFHFPPISINWAPSSTQLCLSCDGISQFFKLKVTVLSPCGSSLGQRNGNK